MLRMNGRRITAAGIAGLALVSTTLMTTGGSASASAATPKATSCSIQPDDNWPGWVQGRPSGINPLTTAHIYMWHDGDGWHIRATHHNTNLRSFSGQLSTSGKFAKVHAVHLEKSDQFSVASDGHTISFVFKNYGYIDGVDFRTHCAPSISFAFQSDGKTAPASKIIVGKNSAHPRNDPFTINRH